MPTETILLLDQDEILRRAMARLLGAQGYTMLQASTGADALEVLAAHTGPVHLLIVDVRLQMVSGARVGTALRARYPALRTLITSGGTDPGDGTFVQKPFEAGALLARVRSLLVGAGPG